MQFNNRRLIRHVKLFATWKTVWKHPAVTDCAFQLRATNPGICISFHGRMPGNATKITSSACSTSLTEKLLERKKDTRKIWIMKLLEHKLNVMWSRRSMVMNFRRTNWLCSFMFVCYSIMANTFFLLWDIEEEGEEKEEERNSLLYT